MPVTSMPPPLQRIRVRLLRNQGQADAAIADLWSLAPLVPGWLIWTLSDALRHAWASPETVLAICDALLEAAGEAEPDAPQQAAALRQAAGIVAGLAPVRAE